MTNSSNLSDSSSAANSVEGIFPKPASAINKNASRLQELESRLSILETAIHEHATVLRDRIGIRLDRLEDKLRYESNGLRQSLESQNADSSKKIVQLTESLTAAVDRVELNQQSDSVKSTMEDLIAALAATRTHLDTLAQAVTKTRVELSA